MTSVLQSQRRDVCHFNESLSVQIQNQSWTGDIMTIWCSWVREGSWSVSRLGCGVSLIVTLLRLCSSISVNFIWAHLSWTVTELCYTLQHSLVTLTIVFSRNHLLCCLLSKFYVVISKYCITLIMKFTNPGLSSLSCHTIHILRLSYVQDIWAWVKENTRKKHCFKL